MKPINMQAKYKTRDGRAVEILAVYETGRHFPVLGRIENQGVRSWTSSGKEWHAKDSPCDLIEAGMLGTRPPKFGEMLDADKGALLLAKRDQVNIEWYNNISEIWFWNDYPYLRDDTAYRIAPTRINGTVEVDADGKPDFETWAAT